MHEIHAAMESPTQGRLRRYLVGLLLAMLWTGLFSERFLGAQEADSSSINYELDLNQAITRYARVTMDAPATGPVTQVMMATWTPGSYMVREYARHMDQIEARDENGSPLPIQKISKNRWNIETGNARRFRLIYRLYCNEASVRTNMLNRNYAVINGAATFLTLADLQPRPHRVAVEIPEYWNESASSMRLVSDQPNRYQAADYDELVDSPIVAGRLTTYPFEVAGVPHYLVNVGERAGWDAERAVKDLAALVAEHHRLWGTVPYDRYFFLNVIFPGGGGLEHDYSCLMMTNPFDVRETPKYQGWLSLASHEFFHTWNIRRLRPQELVRYDYESEVYTPSLWIAEGLTSYYEDLLLARAGLISQDDFLKSLGKQISSVQKTEGRLIQSLRDSSHDAWIKFYGSAPNKKDTQISYYTKGAVVGFLLDMEIRSASEGTANLDDVLRVFYERYAGDVGYRAEDFRDVCSEFAGKDLSDWFRLAIDSTEELDYQTAADWLGLNIGEYSPQVAAFPDESEAEDEPATPRRRRGPRPVPWIGVGQVDSPATLAGLADTDEIIGINGKRVTTLDNDLKEFEVGAKVTILIAREGELQELEVEIGSRPQPADWNVSIVREPTGPQQLALKSWLLSDSPTDSQDTNAESLEKASSIKDSDQ
jgi:predicted metalloprotease with PDZ domain